MQQATIDFFNDMEDHGSTRFHHGHGKLEVPHNSLLAVKTKIQTPENFNNSSSTGEEKTCKFKANADLEDEDEKQDYEEEEEEEDDEKSNGMARGRGFER
ncbi:histone H3.v1-like [Pyrus ussuriensis x Pyrus communis]|uniref:Histone H3.v1-like n=1 Tax=Pyrus ussuriensis x Pyrus communis TaxID=2448454 RepID=A0A5N5GJF9_9ROSA|nr:histone H3.v1-like [Pyrus ussuriensis x Pyrus communis]